jgi:hypothetical protein
VAAIAAVVALVPGAASAAPGQDPPKNTFRADYSVSGVVELPDGRQAQYSLAEYREAAQDGWTAVLYLSTWTERDCGDWQCQDDYVSGQTTLDAKDVHFARNLSAARAIRVPVMLQTFEWTWPDGFTYTDVEEVIVSVDFTGSGAVNRSNHHGDLCSDGQTACQAMSIRSSRPAVGTLTVGDQVAHTSAVIGYGQYAETAPKPVTTTPPPGDGEIPPPPGGVPAAARRW